jgi:SAM-dependent methyltransferase
MLTNKIEVNSKCMICGSNAKLKYRNHPGYQKPDTFNIYHCKKCNSSFSMPRCNADSIYEIIYKNGPTVPGYNRYWEYATRVKEENNPLDYLADTEDCYWCVKEALKQTISDKKKMKILEIGCGLGYLTFSIFKQGYNILGVDISEQSIKHATKNFGNIYLHADLYEYAPKHKQEYDVIILTEVIEHLDDINSFMSMLKMLLKPGGKIILTTPNKSFYPSNIIWASDLPPVHCWWLSEDSIKYIASTLKLTVSFIDFKEFYAKHPVSSDMKILEYLPITPVVLDENGNLLWEINKNLKQSIKSLTVKIGNRIKRILTLLTEVTLVATIQQKFAYKLGSSLFSLREINAKIATSELLNRNIIMPNNQSLSEYIISLAESKSSFDKVSNLNLLKIFNQIVKADLYKSDISELDLDQETIEKIKAFKANENPIKHEIKILNKLLLQKIYPQTLKKKDKTKIMKQCDSQGIVICAILENK